MASELHRFSSLSSFLDTATSVAKKARGDHEWDLGMSGKEACKAAREGDLSLVERAEDILREIETHIAEGTEMVLEPSVNGRRPHVPSFIAGAPKSMRRRMPREGSGKSVRIFVQLSAASLISGDQLLKRGCAVIALIESLQRSQVHVDLFLTYRGAFSESRRHELGFGVIVPIESQPLDLSVAGFAMAHPAFMRNVMFSYADMLFSKSTFATGPMSTGAMRELFELEADDVYVPRANHDDRNIYTNPTAWVQKHLSQITGE